MRARDSKRQADELAAVVRWLREQARGYREAAETNDDRMGCAPLVRRLLDEEAGRWLVRARALDEAADALERGEHHAP